MKMAIKHENDKFLVITLKHISSLTIVVNRPRTPKLWTICHENGHKMENDKFLVITLKHISGLIGQANLHGTLVHENGHKMRQRRAFGHISET